MRSRSYSLCSVLIAAAVLSSCGGSKGAKPDAGAPAVGSAKISWVIVSPAGQPVSCSGLAVDEATVSIGSAPVHVACGGDQTVTFPSLQPQRYPVVVQLLKLGA